MKHIKLTTFILSTMVTFTSLSACMYEEEVPEGAVAITETEVSIVETMQAEGKSEDEIIDYLVVIANESYSKAEELRKENRMLTRKEALERASRGASYLRAVLRYCGKEAVF